MHLPILKLLPGRSNWSLMLIAVFAVFLFTQCGNRDESTMEDTEMVAEEPAEQAPEEVDVVPVPVPVVMVVKEREKLKERHKTRAAVVEKQPETYAKIEHKEIVKAPTRESKKEIIFVPHRKTYVPILPPEHPEAKTLAEMEPVRKLTEFDTPPMYAAEDCLSKKHPEHCSHVRLQRYFSQNVDMSLAPADNQDHVEFATFIIRKDGSVDPDMIEVIDQTPHCAPCAQEAKRLVREMEDKWMPATWNGEAVDARVTLPIRFHKYDI